MNGRYQSEAAPVRRHRRVGPREPAISRPPPTRTERSRHLRFVAEDRIDVAGAVQHPYHVDPAVDGFVEDHLPPERKAAHVGRELASGAAHHGLCRDELQRLVEPVNPPVGQRDVVFRDVVPDVEDVGRPSAADG